MNIRPPAASSPRRPQRSPRPPLSHPHPVPPLTLPGLLCGGLVGGAVVTEAVFARAGLGQLTAQAVANRDTPVLLAVVILSTMAFVAINLVVDLLYPVLDPRLRSSRAARRRTVRADAPREEVLP